MRLTLTLPLLLVGACLVSCQQQALHPTNGGPGLFVTPKDPSIAAVDITLKFPPLPPIDFGLLDSDEFIPPGAKVIWPDPKINIPFHVTPRGKFPSTDEVVSLDNAAVVGSRSEEAYKGMRHWLRLFRRGDTQARSILWTNKSFEALWSKDSLGLAITHFTGENHAEVLVLRVRDERETKRIEPRPALEPYLSSVLLDSPRFEKAYRWSDGPTVIVRGIGRLAAEPYDLFGYEIAVDSAHPDDPTRMRFIRGFVKAGRPREVAAQGAL